MFNRFISDMKKYFRFSLFSARAQLKTEVANSYLNWVWWVLDPLRVQFKRAVFSGIYLYRAVHVEFL